MDNKFTFSPNFILYLIIVIIPSKIEAMLFSILMFIN